MGTLGFAGVSFAALESNPYDCSVMTNNNQPVMGGPHYNLSCVIAAGGMDANRPSVCEVSRTKLEGPDGVQSDHESFDLNDAPKQEYKIELPNGNAPATAITIEFSNKTRTLATISDGPDRKEKCHKHEFSIHALKGVKPPKQ